jgi:hypothetical protein
MKKMITLIAVLAALFSINICKAEMVVKNESDCQRYKSFYKALIGNTVYMNNYWNIAKQQYEPAVLVFLRDGSLNRNDTQIAIYGSDLQAGLTLIHYAGKEVTFTINADCSVNSYGYIRDHYSPAIKK